MTSFVGTRTHLAVALDISNKIGRLPIERLGANRFFQLISRRILAPGEKISFPMRWENSDRVHA